ncbi:MAG: right-handed parallel beta-helix repeat-containing protein [Sandaracinus sp.]
MNASLRALATVVSLLGTVLVGCGPSCPSDGELQAALARLAPGDRYALDGRCVVSSGVALSAGTSLEGGTFVLGPGESIRLATGGTTPTTLAHVQVSSTSAAAAVIVDGDGTAQISDVAMTLEAGIGIGVRGGTAAITDVTIDGNVDPAHVLELPVPADPATLATYGVVVLGGHTTLERVDVRHLASAGVVCESAQLDLRSTIVVENRGIAIELFDCEADLASTEVYGTLDAPGLPGLGVVAAEGTVLTASALTVRDEPGIGVFVDASTATLTSPTIARLGQAGAYARTMGTLDVQDGTFTAVAGAAIATVGAARLSVARTTIADTTPAPILTPGGAGSTTMADGIHVAQDATTTTEVRIDDTTLRNNERIGAVLDGAARPLDVTLSGVRVEGTGEELGVVAQNVASLPAGWDASVTRVGSPLTLDATAPLLAVSSGAGAIGILMPPTISF